MKRLPSALMAAVVGPLAIVGGSQANPHDMAQGGGMNSSGWTLGFNGYDDPNNGQVEAISPTGLRYHGDVDCVRTDGPLAVLTGTLSNGNNFQLWVQDNGEGKNAPADRADFTQTNDPLDCTVNTPIATMVTGGIQVK